MADKKKFSKAPSQKQKFQFTGLEPKMKYKGDPYESIKDTDTEVDMKDMAAVFSKGGDDGFMYVLIALVSFINVEIPVKSLVEIYEHCYIGKSTKSNPHTKTSPV